MSLVKNERVHLSQWTSNLPDDLKSITLAIMGKSSDSVSLIIQYDYKNIDKLEEQKKKIEKDSL